MARWLLLTAGLPFSGALHDNRLFWLLEIRLVGVGQPFLGDLRPAVGVELVDLGLGPQKPDALKKSATVGSFGRNYWSKFQSGGGSVAQR